MLKIMQQITQILNTTERRLRRRPKGADASHPPPWVFVVFNFGLISCLIFNVFSLMSIDFLMCFPMNFRWMVKIYTSSNVIRVSCQKLVPTPWRQILGIACWDCYAFEAVSKFLLQIVYKMNTFTRVALAAIVDHANSPQFISFDDGFCRAPSSCVKAPLKFSHGDLLWSSNTSSGAMNVMNRVMKIT